MAFFKIQQKLFTEKVSAFEIKYLCDADLGLFQDQRIDTPTQSILKAIAQSLTNQTSVNVEYSLTINDKQL